MLNFVELIPIGISLAGEATNEVGIPPFCSSSRSETIPTLETLLFLDKIYNLFQFEIQRLEECLMKCVSADEQRMNNCS